MTNFRLRNVTKNKTYIVSNLEAISYKREAEVTDISLPESDSDLTLLMKYGGVREEINISWKLVESTVDLSEGTNTPQIYTVIQQRDYLLKYFATYESGDSFTLAETDGTYSKSGVSAEVMIDYKGQDVGVVAMCNLKFMVGMVV